MAEPAEEAIASFVSFTSTTREQAIAFLKANNLDSQKAINAYFEDPTGPQPEHNVIQATCDIPNLQLANASKPIAALYNDNRDASWSWDQGANAPPIPPTAPPSRPPSRTDIQEQKDNPRDSVAIAPQGPENGLSLAQREEKELQQAVAMSLNSDMGQQESGVTSLSQPHFSKAMRDHYDENAWAMTLFKTSSEEVTISPDPEDRKRVEGEPAFIRPNPDSLYLGGLLTILHNIPLAREALLLRNKLLFDYGHEPQWWNGHSINLPKIVTMDDDIALDSDWDGIIHETQRLMAFMDTTKRAFGSADSLARVKSMSSFSSDSDEAVARFLEAWHGAAIQMDPENPLTTLFTSHAYKKELFGEFDEPNNKELFVFEPAVEREQDQSLYEVLDSAFWSDSPGQELDDTWLEHVAEVLVFKIDALQKPNPVGVEIPPVFYPDRYLSSCREVSREFRSRRQQIQGDVLKKLLEQAATAVPKVAPERGSGDPPSAGPANADTISITEKLKSIATKIEAKLKGKHLEARKQKALESLHELSKTLTEPPKSPSEPPVYKYTLRGVCTEPHVTYVLSNPKTTAPVHLMDMDTGTETTGDYQWWRISFSQEDGKLRQAEKRKLRSDPKTSENGDVVGYTIRKVEEAEVPQAAREEGSSILLVYASENAMNAQVDHAPSQLQGFVNRDNDAFGDEFQNTPNIVLSDQDGSWLDSNGDGSREKEQKPERPKAADVNVFDYEVSDFDDEQMPDLEMEERGGVSLLGAAAPNAAALLASKDASQEKDANNEDIRI
ncbi:hypothetical protein N7461_001429 [Penicillium sp. DV-2018c]|nr:hypothetical protein N7461_001429 [Penicillium sp. DV-2018c]